MEGIFKTYPIKDATQKDAVTYVSILFSLAQVDELDQKEDEAIRLLVSENGWSKDIYQDAKAIKSVTIESFNFSPETIRVFGPYLIRDLCAIAHVSRGFSEKEDELIDSVREKLGMSNEVYSLIKVSVQSQLEAVKSWSKVLPA